MDGYASKSWRERVSLGEAFFLNEIVVGAVGSAEVASVGCVVHELEVGEYWFQGGRCCYDSLAGISRCAVEEIVEIEEEERSCGWLVSLVGGRDVVVKLCLS